MSQDGSNIPDVPKVTYRLVAPEDIGKADLKFYKKKTDADEPENPSAPVGAATVTIDNKAEYVVENAAAVGESGSGNAESNISSPSDAQIREGVQLAKAITDEMASHPGGRRRSKRRQPRRSAKQSKKGGRSRKNRRKQSRRHKH